MKADLLGINIDFISYSELLECIFGSDIRTITYANQYVLNESFRDDSLKHNLQSFDLIHPDGIGVQKALKKIYNENSARITGSDLYYKIFDVLNKKRLSVFLYGSEPLVLKKAADYIRKNYENISINGSIDGFSDISNEALVNYINESPSYILFVGTGTPRQEEWIINNKHLIKAEKIISIGGGLRVISGDRIRGPVFMRKLGLEWLVRLFEEPVKNFKRYIIGIPLFLIRLNRQRKRMA